MVYHFVFQYIGKFIFFYFVCLRRENEYIFWVQLIYAFVLQCIVWTFMIRISFKFNWTWNWWLKNFLFQLCCSTSFNYFCNSLVQIVLFLFLEAIFYAWFETRVIVFQVVLKIFFSFMFPLMIIFLISYHSLFLWLSNLELYDRVYT